MRKILQSPEFNLAASSVGTAVVTALAFAGLGFVGVMLVGVFIALVAVRIDLGTAGPIGLLGMEVLTPEQRADIRAGVASRSRVLFWAKLIGLTLAFIGSVGFLVLQLPHRYGSG